MRSKELSISQRKLLALMQRVNYGRINNFSIVKGEPVISPEATIEREIKLDVGDSHSPCGDDFQLKKKVTDFFDHLKHIGDGFIRKVEIRGGIPILLQTEEKIA